MALRQTNLVVSALCLILCVLSLANAQKTKTAAANTAAGGQTPTTTGGGSLLTELDRAIFVRYNRSVDMFFGGLGNLMFDDSHLFIINSTLVAQDLEKAGKSLSTELAISLKQDEHDTIFLAMYMSKSGFPTPRKYEWKTETQTKWSVEIKIPGLKHGIDWYIVIKPSKNPGVWNKLPYRLLLIDKSELKTNQSGSTLGTFFTILFTLAGGLGAFYYFFVYRKQAEEAAAALAFATNTGTVKWLVDDNELIPFNELEKRKFEIKYANPTVKLDEFKQQQHMGSPDDPAPSGPANSDSPPKQSLGGGSVGGAKKFGSSNANSFGSKNNSDKKPNTPPGSANNSGNKPASPTVGVRPQVAAPGGGPPKSPAPNAANKPVPVLKPNTPPTGAAGAAAPTGGAQKSPVKMKQGSVGEKTKLFEQIMSGAK